MLDPDFGVEGAVDIVPPGNFAHKLTEVKVDAAGRILLYGHYQRASSAFDEMGAVRLLADGRVDTTFGDMRDGFLTGPRFDHPNWITSLALRKDGQLLATGWGDDVVPLVFFDGDGKLSGQVDVEQAPPTFYAQVLAFPDGKLVISSSDADGGVLHGRHADGSVDETFGDGGTVHFLGGSVGIIRMALGVDGHSFFVAGRQDNNAVIGKFGSGGDPDPDFGEAGFVRLKGRATPNVDCRGIHVLPDGGILARLNEDGGTRTACHLVRLNIDGSTDRRFNRGDWLRLPGDVGRGLAVDDDGRILAATFAQGGESRVLRLLPDGQRDTTFGPDGSGDFRIPSTTLVVLSLDVQDDMKILLGGQRGFQSRVLRLLP